MFFAALVAAALAAAAPASAQWQMVSPDGTTKLNFGFLAQFQAEELQPVGTEDWQQNLFVRRFRIVMGGKVTDRVSIFADTDVPNLGKGVSSGTSAGTKTDNTMILQDLVLTYTVRSEFKVDAGMLLTPASHNGLQSAASHLGVDYGPWSFVQSDSTRSKTGRDYGVLARGYLGDRHLEYRAGLLQGLRGFDSRQPFRGAFRLAYYPFESDTGLFYTGTTLGKRRIVSLGVGGDVQRDYQTLSADLFVDQPVAGGDGFTLQADYTQYDGGTWIPGIAKQTVLLAEAGYYFHVSKFGPFVQYSMRDFDKASLADETKLLGGIAWWDGGHKFNVKAAYGVLTKDGKSDGKQAVLQAQVFAF
ncbi:MAG: porin [Candidatus Eisenbacteria bacterium]